MKQKINYTELLKEIVILTGAMAVISAAVYFFLVPSKTSVSSISGLGIILSNFVPLPLSTITMIMNVMLLIIGFLTCGKEFGVKTIYTSIMLPVFLGVYEKAFPAYQSMTGSQELDVVCYILAASAGCSILFNRNASSGGLDIVAKIMNKSTHNRRERPVYGHCGWSRGRFYYRITTFEGRPWDARDPHKTTFMALKHAIRLSIWRKQKETPGVEKAPGVSSPQRKESGRSGRDDGELRFWVRPGHPRKAVTSISQAEALAHGLTHLHHLVFAAVLARELDWCAALQDAREDARPWGVVGIGLRSDVWVEVRRDDHRPAVLVTRVDDVVDMPHDVIGAAVRPQVVDDEEVILEEARLRLLALVERHRLDVGHDVLHAGLQRGEPEVDDPVGDCRGIERLTCAHLSPEEQPIHVIA